MRKEMPIKYLFPAAETSLGNLAEDVTEIKNLADFHPVNVSE